jgi:hypothetical protein
MHRVIYVNIVKHPLFIYLLVGYPNLFLSSKVTSIEFKKIKIMFHRYTYAEKIWHFLRHGHSNKLALENELQSTSSLGPLPLYKLKRNFSKDQTENTKKTVIKSTNIKEKRPSTGLNSPLMKVTMIPDDQITPETPKMIVFATISHSQSARLSSYSETADRSERLRHYNLNETFSTSVLLTTIRDIPLEPPSPPQSSESIPAWKLIRPRKPKVLPHAEPIGEYYI